ncbi:MAG: hypothetical protein NTU53_10505 [Planctomycetota bacterium]|nr:hypothetical protein [Planctomycetota bacterium]
MRLTDFPNLELLLGETTLYRPPAGCLRRTLNGAIVGGLIAVATLVFFAALVRWAPVLWLWPNTSAIGASFGGMIGLLRKPQPPPDPRSGESPMTGRPLDLT